MRVMTTYSEQPVYAQLLFSWLDLAMYDETGVKIKDVLAKVRWMFKGGDLAASASGGRVAIETSRTRWPSGLSTAMAEAISMEDSGYFTKVRKTARQAELLENVGFLKEILRNRKLQKPLNKRMRGVRMATYCAVTADCQVVKTGMSAVYIVVDSMWTFAERSRQKGLSESMVDYVREVVLASGIASNTSVPDTALFVERAVESLKDTRVAGLKECMVGLQKVIAMIKRERLAWEATRVGQDLICTADYGDHQLTEHDIGMAASPGMSRKVTVGPYAMVVMHGLAYVARGDTVIALGESDLVRAHVMVTGAFSALVAIACQYSLGTELEMSRRDHVLRAYTDSVSTLIRISLTTPLGDEVLACKLSKRVFAVYCSMLCGPLAVVEKEVLLADAYNTFPWAAREVDRQLDSLAGLTPDEAFNVGKVYKLCPAPDASPGGTMCDRVSAISNPNEVDPVMLAELRIELRNQILSARIRAPGPPLDRRPGVPAPVWWDAYIRRDYEHVPVDDLHRVLKWEGTGRMTLRNNLDPSCWKDSGLGADSLAAGLAGTVPSEHRNLMTRMLYDDDCPMPESLSGASEHVHKMEIKPEGHKDPSRAIFSGNIRDRMLKSQCEEGVHEVARHHPSYMIGSSALEKEVRTRVLNADGPDPTCTPTFYSFDVSGWSPNMSLAVQNMSHDLWAEYYGENGEGAVYVRAKDVMAGSTVYMNKGGYIGWYVNAESNFEGYDGKEMTMINIAMLSLSVKHWRRNVVARGLMTEAKAKATRAILLAFIDDGIARVDMPLDNFTELFGLWKETCVDVFLGCGFVVEASKCFPSDVFYIFLNEPYLCGRHIAHGVRAASSICSMTPEEHDTLVDRVDRVSGGARGTNVAGLDSIAASFLMAVHAMLHIAEWVRNVDPVAAAVWTLSPRAWGGLGLPVMMQLGTTASGDALTEGIATLQRYAAISDVCRSYYLNMMRTPMVARRPVELLVAPLSVRVLSGYMSDAGFATAMRVALETAASSGKLSRLATQFLTYGNRSEFEYYASKVVRMDPSTVSQETILDDLAGIHPQSVFMTFTSRFERSTTLKTVLGARKVRLLADVARREAVTSYDCLIDRLSSPVH